MSRPETSLIEINCACDCGPRSPDALKETAGAKIARFMPGAATYLSSMQSFPSYVELPTVDLSV